MKTAASFEEIVEFLKEKKYSELHQLAESIDVSFESLKSIRLGRRKNPKVNTLQKLQKML